MCKDILLSIVMPSFNQAAYLKRALQSVIVQKTEDVELIVIDGGSEDGAVDIIRAYDSQIDYWVSEPDRGQSHAFNKGFARASGRYLTWVNSDDILLPEAIVAFRSFIESNKVADWIAAHSVWIDTNDRLLRCTFNPGWSEFSARRGLLSVTGPTSFFSKRIWERVGGLDESLHYSMDTDLWYRFSNLGCKYELLDHHVWALRIHSEAKVSGKDFSADQEVIAKIKNEHDRIRKRYHLIQPRTVDLVIARLLRLKRFAKIKSAYWTLRLKNRPYDELTQINRN